MLVGALVWLLAGPATPQALDWPLDIKRALSSTFAETRGGGFHAGIDVKTWGKTGYPVKALADGYVLRLRTSPWGYGRAIYHQLADGRVLVYAHLEDFAEPIAQAIENAQRAKGRYSVDLWLKPSQIPLRRGQVIARTGQSGAGPPHLHLEVRNSDNVPVNPLLAGLAVEDGVAPTLRSLALVPFGLGSTVDGEAAPKVVPLRWNKAAGYFEGAYTPQVYGTVGVSLLVYDRADGANNKLAVFRIGLQVDGEPVGGTVYEQVSYADSHQGLLDRLRLEGGTFFNLFRQRGNRLGFYQLAPGETGLLSCGLDTGSIRLGKGPHQLVVEASDVAGNRSVGKIEILVNGPPRIDAVEVGEADGVKQLRARLSDKDDQPLEAKLAWSATGEDWTQIGTANGNSIIWPLERKGGIWRLQVEDGHGGEGRHFFCRARSGGRTAKVRCRL